MPIVIRAILLSMITWRDNSHLMTVNRIIIEEVSCFLIDLSGRILITPHVQQALVHAPRAQLGHFAQVTERAKFGVGHAHVCFVGLHVRCCDGLELGRGRGIEE